MSRIIWKKDKHDVYFGMSVPFFIIFQDLITEKWTLEVRHKFKKTFTTVELGSLEECKIKAQEFWDNEMFEEFVG